MVERLTRRDGGSARTMAEIVTRKGWCFIQRRLGRGRRGRGSQERFCCISACSDLSVQLSLTRSQKKTAHIATMSGYSKLASQEVNPVYESSKIPLGLSGEFLKKSLAKVLNCDFRSQPCESYAKKSYLDVLEDSIAAVRSSKPDHSVLNSVYQRGRPISRIKFLVLRNATWLSLKPSILDRPCYQFVPVLSTQLGSLGSTPACHKPRPLHLSCLTTPRL